MKTIQREPDNKLACFAMADLLEEQGRNDLAFCYRWMGWYDRRPGKREGKYSPQRSSGTKRRHSRFGRAKRRIDFNSLPMTGHRLQPLIFLAMETGNPQYRLYSTWQQAASDLAKALANLRPASNNHQKRKDGGRCRTARQRCMSSWTIRDRLHRAGWSLGETCFGSTWQVDGANGENRLLYAGTASGRRHRETLQAREMGRLAARRLFENKNVVQPSQVEIRSS